MTTDKPTTLVDPSWRLCSGRRTVAGINFISYSDGISSYTQVSENGTIRLKSSHYHAGYCVEVLGHGWIMSGRRATRFRTEPNAVKAALKIRGNK